MLKVGQGGVGGMKRVRRVGGVGYLLGDSACEHLDKLPFLVLHFPRPR